MSPQSPTEDHLRDAGARLEDRRDDVQPLDEKVTPHPRRSRIPASSLAAALLFFLRSCNALTFGDRADPIENRPLAGMPSLNSGWQAIPGLNAWAVDNLPLRSQAVRADA